VTEVRGIEAIILEAMARGEFDHLPGKGKPLDLGPYFDTPEDVRLAYAMLKNAGYLPVEIELLKEIETLRQAFARAADAPAREKIGKEIEDKRLKFNLLMERARQNRSKKPDR
jgi:hypothetical protein